MSTISGNLREIPFVVVEKIRKILKHVLCLLRSPFALRNDNVDEVVIMLLGQGYPR